MTDQHTGDARTDGPAGGVAGAVVAVAGAGGPAGRAVVARLVAAGAHVVAADHNGDHLDEAVAAARAAAGPAGGSVRGEVVDLADTQAVRDWADRVEQLHERVDGLVHLVGGWRGQKDLTPAALDDWADLEPLLVRTVQNTSVAFREPLLRSAGRGRYVLVSAKGATKPTAGNAAYAAAKAAAEAWTLALGHSFRKAGRDAPEGTPAAAVILVVKALVHQAMRDERPDAAFPGFTDTADLAEQVAQVWNRNVNDLNGKRLWLTEQ